MKVNKYNIDEVNVKFKANIFKRSLKYLKPYKFKLIIATLISCFNGLIVLINPKLVQYAIDVTIPNKNIKQLIIIALIMLFIIILSITVDYIRKRMLIKIKQSIVYDLKSEIFTHLQYLPSTYYDTRPHGKILVRVTNYAATVAQSLCNDLIEIIFELINLVFILIFMFTCHVPLTIFTLVFAVLLAIFFIKITPSRRIKQHTVNNKDANSNAYLAESLNGINITQSYNREEKNEKIFGEIQNEYNDAIKKVLPYYNFGWSLTYCASNIVNIGIYALGIFFFYPSTSLGTIVAIGNYSSRFWGPIQNITSIYTEIMDAVTYLERIFELLDEPLLIENSENAKEVKIKGNVEFKNVNFGYLEDKLVLKDINFDIKPNQKIAFVGETGSGKSTIINLLARYYDVNDGVILIDNVPIKEIDLSSLRKQINVMIQDNYVFSRSIKENICYGNMDISYDEMRKVCKELQIDDWIMNLKNGYDTVLHNNGKEISTGQRQLICFARAIIANPKILILDEATSNVDLKTEKLVQEGLKKILENRTSIIIAHRLSTIVNSDQIMLIKDNSIYEKGTHEELMSKKGEYYNLYTSQIQ